MKTLCYPLVALEVVFDGMGFRRPLPLENPAHNVVPGERHAQLFDCVAQQCLVHAAVATVNIVDIKSVLDPITGAVVAPAVYVDGKRVPTVARTLPCIWWEYHAPI